MKKFILNTFYISLPLLAVIVFMEILLRNTPNDYLDKKNYLDKNSAEIETLILGSSHSYFGINPEYFSRKTFNASHPSQSLEYDFEIIKKYQDNFESLKTIVLPISYFSLYGKLENDSESWRIKNYVLYYDMNTSSSLTHYSEFLSIPLKANINRLTSYYIFDDLKKTCTELGYGTTNISKNAKDLMETGKTAALRHTTANKHSAKNIDAYNENILTLNSILDWSKERNIKILLITTPAFSTYRQNLNPEQLNSAIKTASQIASKNDHCIYVNLLSDSRFIATDYYDADHLSEIGAEKLSKIINERINEWQ